MCHSLNFIHLLSPFRDIFSYGQWRVERLSIKWKLSYLYIHNFNWCNRNPTECTPRCWNTNQMLKTKTKCLKEKQDHYHHPWFAEALNLPILTIPSASWMRSSITLASFFSGLSRFQTFSIAKYQGGLKQFLLDWVVLNPPCCNGNGRNLMFNLMDVIYF